MFEYNVDKTRWDVEAINMVQARSGTTWELISFTMSPTGLFVIIWMRVMEPGEVPDEDLTEEV